MKVLVACEESQRVCTAFREKGHEAYSCDLETCSGGHPEWHIMQDVIPLLDGRCNFKTMDGIEHSICGKWDLIIAHPPCTHLASSGARHFEKKRADGRQREAIEFFCKLLNTSCEKVAVEKAPAAPVSAPAPVASTPSEGKAVPAPMQGTILDLKVKVGDAVKAGDTLLILEAMKLENEIKSPTDGKVLSIAVSKGQSVSMNETLLILG